jgi:hypothetical protein
MHGRNGVDKDNDFLDAGKSTALYWSLANHLHGDFGRGL